MLRSKANVQRVEKEHRRCDPNEPERPGFAEVHRETTEVHGNQPGNGKARSRTIRAAEPGVVRSSPSRIASSTGTTRTTPDPLRPIRTATGRTPHRTPCAVQCRLSARATAPAGGCPSHPRTGATLAD